MISPARIAAFDVLLELERRGGHADELLRRPEVDKLSERDRHLATEIVMGVLRWRSTIDRSVAEHSSKPLARLDAEVLTALRMAAYQIGWLERVPASAAVNDSVALVKRMRKVSAAPFANAVLRNITRTRQLLRPGPGGNAPAELAAAYSHPAWLVARWIAAFGSDAAAKICAYGQQVPPAVLRLPGSGTERELVGEGIMLAPGALLAGARRVLGGDLTHSAAFREGRLHLQDEASQLVALLVGHGERILDCCAAPGGKTLLLAERNPHARIIAVEKNSKRAAALRKRIAATNVEVVTAEVRAFPGRETFDRILLDVPCSGTGTLARNPEIKWRVTPECFQDFQREQRELLAAALSRLAPGGRLVYSTCSLEAEEDEDVVAEAAARAGVRIAEIATLLAALRATGELIYPDLESLVRGPYLRTLPGVHPCDGFFAAVLEKA